MNKKLRIGIIGLGEHMLRAHVAHLVTMPEVEIVGWYDPDLEKLELPEVTEYGLKEKYFQDEQEIFEHSDIDAIFIGSPDKYHSEQLWKAVALKKHVFCEKPLLVEWDNREGSDNLRNDLLLAKTLSKVVSSCHPRRYDPPIVWLKNQLSSPNFVEETFGIIKEFKFEFYYHKVTDAWKKDRSLMLDHFGHEIDLYRFLFGNESAWNAELLHDSYMQYRVRGKGGTISNPSFEFIGNRTLDEKVYRETIFISSSKTTWVLQLNDGVGYDTTTGRMFTFPKKDYGVMFQSVNQNFVDAILKGTPSYLTHEDMLVNNLSGVMLKENGSVRSEEPNYLIW